MSGDGEPIVAGPMIGLEDLYELTPMQEGMLFDGLSAGDSTLYLIQIGYELRGKLDGEALRRAFQQVVRRHAALRTSFHWESLEKPLQAVHEAAVLPWEERDWTDLAADEQERRLEAFWDEDRARGIDYETAPLMRITLIRRGPDEHHLVWTFHHILFEGWSASILLEEVLSFYEADLSGEPLELARPIPYRDYILWLQRQDRGGVERYWRSVLDGLEVPTALGIDRSPGSLYAPVNAYDGLALELSAEATADLEAAARDYRVTLNTLVQGAWALVLSRYSGDSDVVFGSIVSGRSVPLRGVESMVGLFINILPTRVVLPPDETTISWLKTLQERAVEQREYEYSPLVEVKGWSDVPGGVPLFESILIFENWLGDISLQDRIDGLEVRDIVSRQGGPGYPIALIAQPGSRLSFAISYDCERFDRGAIERMLGHLRTALEEIVANPEGRLADLSILSAAEEYQLLVEWNDTRRDYTPKCVHRLFEEQVVRTPDATALVAGEARFTYDELNRRANQLADHLMRLGVGPDVGVGIFTDRNAAMIVGVLGIMKAGGAYVPLDPNYPADRLAFMVRDAEIAVLVTEEAWVESLPASDAEVVILDPAFERIADGSEENPITEVTPSNLVYIIYTSGSTGRPKGVLIEHRSLANYVEGARRVFALGADDSVLQFASITFDTAAEEIFPCLTAGATLVLRSDSMLDSPARFLEACGDSHITVLDLPTAYWHQLSSSMETDGLAAPRCLRLLILGGEAALPEHLAAFRKNAHDELRILNTYGPTEATIVATWCELDDRSGQAYGNVIPIGRPVANVQTYILDPGLHPVPPGVPGELCIGGAGVARGYLNRDELTRERFVSHPFSDDPEARLYRTGDQVRYLPDGNLEFLGRIDHQVKLRGFRIELGEIEATLSGHAAIRQAVALVREDEPGDKRLVAYLVTAAEPCPTPSELRGFLLESLPDYMVPSAFVELDELPLTPNGKIDRPSLPAPDRSRPELGGGFQAPRTPLEQAIGGIWAEILRLESVGIRDDFFELGGHSLLAIQLVTRLRDTFRVDLAVRRLFESPTVAGLAEALVADEALPGQTKRIAEIVQQIEQMSDVELSGALDDISEEDIPSADASLAVGESTAAEREELP